MNKDRLLLTLVVADVLLAFAAIGSEWVFHWTLPDSLRQYVRPSMFSLSSPWDVRLVFLWSVSILSTFIAWIGLLNFWWFARRLYVVGWGSWILLVLLSGPSVMTSVEAAVTTLNAVVGGAILALVYSSDLATQFERTRVRTSTLANTASG